MQASPLQLRLPFAVDQHATQCEGPLAPGMQAEQGLLQRQCVRRFKESACAPLVECGYLVNHCLPFKISAVWPAIQPLVDRLPVTLLMGRKVCALDEIEKAVASESLRPIGMNRRTHENNQGLWLHSEKGAEVDVLSEQHRVEANVRQSLDVITGGFGNEDI